MMIYESGSAFDRQFSPSQGREMNEQYVRSMERRITIQQEEIQRRQQLIDRLERELLREKRFKHSEHICENCSQPCVKKGEDYERQIAEQARQLTTHSHQFMFKKLNTNTTNRYTSQIDAVGGVTHHHVKIKQVKQTNLMSKTQADPASIKSHNTDQLNIKIEQSKNSGEGHEDLTLDVLAQAETKEASAISMPNTPRETEEELVVPQRLPPTKKFKPEIIEKMAFKIKTEDDPVDERGMTKYESCQICKWFIEKGNYYL